MASIIKQILNCQKCAGLMADYSKERKDNLSFAYRFKPQTVQCLWIVESPPFSQPPRYFYRSELTRYDSLFREIMKVLNIAPSNPKDASLCQFQARGHFLIDAAKCPVDKENVKFRPKLLDNCSQILQDEVMELQPKMILVIKTGIYNHVCEKLSEIGFRKKILNHKPICFPGSGQQKQFRRAIRKYLELGMANQEG